MMQLFQQLAYYHWYVDSKMSKNNKKAEFYAFYYFEDHLLPIIVGVTDMWQEKKQRHRYESFGQRLKQALQSVTLILTW